MRFSWAIAAALMLAISALAKAYQLSTYDKVIVALTGSYCLAHKGQLTTTKASNGIRKFLKKKGACQPFKS